MFSGKKSNTIDSTGAMIIGQKKSIGINEYLIRPQNSNPAVVKKLKNKLLKKDKEKIKKK